MMSNSNLMGRELTALGILWALIGPLIALAQTGVNPGAGAIKPPQPIYSPYVGRGASGSDFAGGVFWGDTHLHTSYSTDAGMIGNTLPPEEAYRFALGQEVTTSSGQRARLIRPPDCLCGRV